MPDKANEWYLVQFKPNSHSIALRNLTRQGFETFLPMLSVTSRVGSRFMSKSRPLFPGYLFVALDTVQGAWRALFLSRGSQALCPMIWWRDCRRGAMRRGF